MYRVRPDKKSCKERVKRYPRNLKVRLDERFVSTDDYYFEEKLTKQHLEKGVWICLTHFTGITETEFLSTLRLPDSAAFVKDSRKKNKTRVEVRVSALPSLGPLKLQLKQEPVVEDQEEEDFHVVSQYVQPRVPSTEEVEVLYVSPAIGEKFKFNKRFYSRFCWETLEKVPELSIASLQFFRNSELCLPMVVDRYMSLIARETPKVMGLQTLVFEASLNKGTSQEIEKYLREIDYHSDLRYIFLPYYFFARWSVVVYDLEKTQLTNYVLTPAYDWKVSRKVEQILTTLQDVLMLRRVPLLHKNTRQNFSEEHDSQFLSGVKVLTVIRDVINGEDPEKNFWKEVERVHVKTNYFDVFFGHLINPEDDLPLIKTALATDTSNLGLTVQQKHNLFIRK
jgi:hypothetical protein